MKTTLFALLISINCIGQTIGDSYDTIKKKSPGGQFDTNYEQFTYTVVNNNFYDLYFFDADLICFKIAHRPLTEGLMKARLDYMNKNWEKVTPLIWKFQTDAGDTLYCEFDVVEKVGTLFWIYKPNNEFGKEATK